MILKSFDRFRRSLVEFSVLFILFHIIEHNTHTHEVSSEFLGKARPYKNVVSCTKFILNTFYILCA
jgi:hypothetical protein